MQKEVYKALRDAQDKYVYFFLTASGAAIAFALNQTQTSKLALTQLPLGAALFLWGSSFFCGCRHIQFAASTLYANAQYYEVVSGADPEVGGNKQMMSIAASGIRKAAEENSESAASWGRLQFKCFIAGCSAYVVWHVYEMFLRSFG